MVSGLLRYDGATLYKQVSVDAFRDGVFQILVFTDSSELVVQRCILYIWWFLHNPSCSASDLDPMFLS